MRVKTCPKKNEHEMHYYEIEVSKACNGKTECGQWAHKPHTYVEKETIQCLGVCRCSYVSHPHSPAKHPEGRRVD